MVEWVQTNAVVQILFESHILDDLVMRRVSFVPYEVKRGDYTVDEVPDDREVLCRMVEQSMNTHPRMTAIFRPMGSVPFESLGGIYSRYELSIDITHRPFIHSSNAKVLNCFAAGGFMFVDWKDDLRQALGDLAEEFMYRNADDLNSKMDRLKGNPEKQLEIIQAVREAVSKDLNFLALQTDVIRKAASSFPAQGARVIPT